MIHRLISRLWETLCHARDVTMINRHAMSLNAEMRAVLRFQADFDGR
jgi:hypothetical protein